MQRRQFETNLDKVFDFSARVAAMPEGRHYAQHPWNKVWDAVFLGAAVQIPNRHYLEAECRQGVLAERIGALSEDTMGYALERQDPPGAFALGCEVARRLKRNGVLHSDWARGPGKSSLSRQTQEIAHQSVRYPVSVGTLRNRCPPGRWA